MLRRMCHPRGWLCLCLFCLVTGLAAEAYAQAGFLQGIETKAVQLKDGVLAIAKIVLVVVFIFFGIQVARGDREAWSKAIAAFVGVLLVFQADNIIAWIGS